MTVLKTVRISITSPRYIYRRTVTISVVGNLDVRQYRPPDAERVFTVYQLALEDHGWEFGEQIPADQEVTDSYLGISENYCQYHVPEMVGKVTVVSN